MILKSISSFVVEIEDFVGPSIIQSRPMKELGILLPFLEPLYPGLLFP